MDKFFIFTPFFPFGWERLFHQVHFEVGSLGDIVWSNGRSSSSELEICLCEFPRFKFFLRYMFCTLIIQERGNLYNDDYF